MKKDDIYFFVMLFYGLLMFILTINFYISVFVNFGNCWTYLVGALLCCQAAYFCFKRSIGSIKKLEEG